MGTLSIPQAWDTPYQGILAEIATRNGGKILHVTHGLDYAAAYALQCNPIDQVVMVVPPEQLASAEAWCASDEVMKPVTVKGEADWSQCLASFGDGTFDGILLEVPTTEQVDLGALFSFMGEARRVGKHECVVTSLLNIL